jgi:hypothetical protein
MMSSSDLSEELATCILEVAENGVLLTYSPAWNKSAKDSLLSNTCRINLHENGAVDGTRNVR